MNKKKIVLIFILALCFSSIMMVLFIQKAKASSDLDYIFNNDILFNEYNPIPSNTYNIRNKTYYNGIYKASYSFTNELGLTSSDISFVDTDNSGLKANVSINSTFLSHNNILNLTPHITGDNAHVENNIDSQVNGTIEFWLLHNDATYRSNFFGYDGATIGFQIRLDHDEFAYYDGSEHVITDAYDNIWYHIRIDYECGIGNYLGLSNDKFYITINGTRHGSYPFRNGINSLTTFELLIDDNNDYSAYFDAIGYSWLSNYSIFENTIPNSYKTSEQEIDKWMFSINDSGIPYSNFDSNLDGWTESDVSNQVYHYRINNLTYYQFYHSTIDVLTIEKTFSYENGIIDIIIENDLMVLTTDGFIRFMIYSYDTTLITSIIFVKDGSDYKVLQYDGSSSILLYETNESVLASSNKIFNIHINNMFCKFDFIAPEYSINESFIFLKIAFKEGLSKIIIRSDIDITIQKFRIDNIGVYINGNSIVDDFAYQDIEGNENTELNLKSNSRLVIIGNGTFGLNINTSNGLYGLIEVQEFNNISTSFSLENIHDTDTSHTPPLIRIFFNSTYTIHYIYFEQLRLTEGINKYYMDFSYENINITDNYFYVYGNRLYFSHTANENDTLEYIQAKFNVIDYPNINKSVSFSSYFYGISKSYFIINYLSLTSSYFEFKLGNDNINVLLPQQQITKNFVILITDNDNNDYYGNSEGYISGITIRYHLDIELTLLTLDLISIIIPIILIFIPTIALYTVYGKKIIIPMLILMTIICYFGNLLPDWLFAIMMICFASTLILQYKYRDDVK